MGAISTLLLGTDPRQRPRASLALLGLGIYLVFAAIQHGEVEFGFIELEASNRLSAFNLTGAALFYLVMRSGLNLRFTRDPSLTEPQMAFAMVSIAWSYAISGPTRGAVMSIMMLVILYGIFTLPARRGRRLSLLGFFLLGVVMVHKALFDPGSYDPRVDLIHLLFALVVMAAVSHLAIRFSRLRTRLQTQKLELLRALDRIRELATRDPLTNLLNRRAMTEVLHSHTGDRRFAADGLSLALIDLDHFKRVNDSHGHAVGDQVLQHFARVALGTLRSGDVMARWGGEEFLLMLPGTSPAEAMVSVERIRTQLSSEPFVSGQAPTFVIAFSCGVAACLVQHDIEAAIERADQAMYRAKTSGRNRSLVALDSDHPRVQLAAAAA